VILQNYRLDKTILKAPEAVKLLHSEKGIVEIKEDTLAIPIEHDDELEGYVLHGHGKLLLDTIVETKEGAIGKSVEKEVNEPFLMLGNVEELQNHLSEASKNDLMKMGYENEQTFTNRAENLLNLFLSKRRVSNFRCCRADYGSIFAFPNEAGNLDLLVAHGSHLVYKTAREVFVSNRNNVVLKTPNGIVISR